MDISGYISPIGGLVGLMISIVTFLLSYQKFKNIKGEKAKELHTSYSEIKRLSVDMTANYPEILILMSGLTQAELTSKEVEWFINEPGAFLKLEQYGKICGRYCQVNLDKREFAITERISTSKKRVIEKLKIAGVGFGLLAFLSLVWCIIIFAVKTAFVIYSALAVWFIYSLLVLWGINFLWKVIDKAVKLQGKPLKNSIQLA